MSRSKLYNLSFQVKRIHFEPKIEREETTVYVTFIDHNQQMLFDPVVPPDSRTLTLNAGKTFTFGLSHDTESDLAKKFVIDVTLEQTDSKTCLSKAEIDFTDIFCGVYKNHCHSNVKTQTDTTVEFADGQGETMARMDVTVRLFRCGPTIVNEFVLNGDHRTSTASGRSPCAGRRGHRATEAPATGAGNGCDDPSEWNVVGAELGNGQKIAIKYKKSRYALLSAHEPCGYAGRDDGAATATATRSEEEFNGRVVGLMGEMHEAVARMVAAKANDGGDDRGRL